MSRTAFAQILGITPAAVKAWDATRNFKDCYSETKIDLNKALRFLYDWKCELEANAEDTDKSNSPALERKRNADAEKAELQVKLIREELVSKDEYLATEKERLSIIREGVMDIPAMLAAELALDETQRNLVKNKCRSVLMRAKDTFNQRKDTWLDFINGAK